MARKPPPSKKIPQPATVGQSRWPQTLLVLGVLMVFFQVCGHEFLVYDDNQNIFRNELVTRLTPANLLRFWQEPFAGMYIPLTYHFWSLQAAVAALLPAGQETLLNPYLFHTVNLGLHLANALLVFSLIRRLVRNDWASLLGALLFAVHPVQVEAVAWVTGGKDLLGGLLSLLSLWLYVDYAQAEATGRRRLALYLAALGFFLAALLAKPSAVVVPLVAGAVGLGLSHRGGKQTAFELAPWAGLALPIVILTAMAQPAASHAFLPSLWQRLLISGDSLAFYLYQLIAPLRLGPDYGRTPQLVLEQGWVSLTGVIPCLLASVIFWRARPVYRTAAGIFVLSLLPVLGLIPFTFQLISTVADRYLYLAMLGPALAVAWLLGQVQTRAVWGAAMAILALFASKSMTQVPIWKDSITFHQHAITVNPRSWTAYGNLGSALADRNRHAEAIGYYQQALTLKPDDEKSAFNLGVSYGALDQREAAIAAFRKSVELVQGDPRKEKHYKVDALSDSYVNLGVLYEKEGRQGEAIAAYQQAIAIDPAGIFAYANLAILYAESGQNDEAIAMYQQALALEPSLDGANGNLGLLLAAKGDLQGAVGYFRQALAQNPDDQVVRLNLGLALYHGNDLAEAGRQLLQVVQSAPASVGLAIEAYNGLGAVYMAQGQWQEASEAWRAVLRYAPDHQDARENLAKAQAARQRPR